MATNDLQILAKEIQLLLSGAGVAARLKRRTYGVKIALKKFGHEIGEISFHDSRPTDTNLSFCREHEMGLSYFGEFEFCNPAFPDNLIKITVEKYRAFRNFPRYWPEPDEMEKTK
jgi:hypothetical protein